MRLTGYLRASCEETSRLLSDYAEGELRGFQRWRIERHLAICERCTAILRSLRRTIESLHALGHVADVRAQPALADTVVERIRREQGGTHPPG